MSQDVGVPFDANLAERIRQRLAGLDAREVAMFGGRSFMVHDQLAVCAASDGSLLLRCAPDEADRLVRRQG
ncbi:MAG: hypothetical protein ABJ314_11790, partial [Ilumatobacter sp.]